MNIQKKIIDLKNFLNNKTFIHNTNIYEQDINLVCENDYAVYFGIDLSASGIHIGHISILNQILHLDKIGLQTFILIGEATTFLGGDPTGRNKERDFLSLDEIKANKDSMEFVLKRFIKVNNLKTLIVNNKDWLDSILWIDIVRKIYSKNSINQLIKQDFFKKRLANHEHISLNEVIYPTIQGYDFLYLAEHKNCFIQIGGQDQFMNICYGLNLIKKILNKKQVFFITFKLITNKQNEKISKSSSTGCGLLINIYSKSFYIWHQVFSLDDFIAQNLFDCLNLSIENNKLNILQIKIKIANFIVKSFFGEEELCIVLKINQNHHFSEIKTLKKVLDVIEVSETSNIKTLLQKTKLFRNNKEIISFVKQEKLFINKEKILDFNRSLKDLKKIFPFLLKISTKNIFYVNLTKNI